MSNVVVFLVDHLNQKIEWVKILNEMHRQVVPKYKSVYVQMDTQQKRSLDSGALGSNLVYTQQKVIQSGSHV